MINDKRHLGWLTTWLACFQHVDTLIQKVLWLITCCTWPHVMFRQLRRYIVWWFYIRSLADSTRAWKIMMKTFLCTTGLGRFFIFWPLYWTITFSRFAVCFLAESIFCYQWFWWNYFCEQITVRNYISFW